MYMILQLLLYKDTRFIQKNKLMLRAVDECFEQFTF